MPAPQNLEQFLGLVRKSGLVESARLESFLQQISLNFGPDADVDVKEFSQLLLRAGMLSQFQSDQLLQGKWRGFGIGKYRVLERLGSGGMGNVYLCEHLTMCHKVAVKVLPTAKNNDPAALGRFYREARAAGVLDHPNLVRAFDIDQDGDLHFLVMEYVDGINLQHLVVRQRTPLSVLRACHYMAQAAQGLEHAFKTGLVHRDIKPANILLDRSGTVRILDMGLARFFNDHEDLLTLKYDDKNVLGTADYLSPEQATDSHNVDIRSDIYSLGATFYFLLTGQPLFPEGKVAQKLIWHQTRPPTPIRELRPDVPAELTALIDRMLAKEPRQRFQTPGALLVALEPWIQTPIDPPADDEIPRLSLAARVTSSPDIELLSRQSMQRGRSVAEIDGRPYDNGPTVRRRQDAAGVNTPRRIVSVNENTPRVLATERPSARTAPAPAPLDQTPGAAATVGEVEKRLPLWRRHATLVLAIALVFGIGGGVTLRCLFTALFGQDTNVVREARVLVVSRCGEVGTYATVAQALQAAEAGDRILIREDNWDETLTLDAAIPASLSIEGAAPSGKPVVWRTPAGRPESEPIVRVRGANGLKLGKIVFDGQDRAEVLVRVEQATPGLVIEDVHFKDARRLALQLNDGGGTATAPVVIQRVRVTSRHALDSGVLIQGRPGHTTAHVQIKDARFEGTAQAAVSVEGGTEAVELSRNRIYNVLDGFHFSGPAASHKLVIQSNTLREVQRAAVHFDQLPAVETSVVQIDKNLFQRTAALTLIDNFAATPDKSGAKWIAPAKTGEIAYFRRSFELDSSLQSATLDLGGSTSASVWINGKPVGQADYNPTARRVGSFDVLRYLLPGRNVIAVQVQGNRAPVGLLAELNVKGRTSSFQLVSDSGWRVSDKAPTGWQQGGFADATWEAARVEDGDRLPAEWEHPLWDRVVRERLKNRVNVMFPHPSGNVRDGISKERYPALEATVVEAPLPTDPGDDRRFLRYPANSPLTGHGSPGVAP